MFHDAEAVLTVVADAAANVGSGKVRSTGGRGRGVRAGALEGGANKGAGRGVARGAEAGQATREGTTTSTAARISDRSIMPEMYRSLAGVEVDGGDGRDSGDGVQASRRERGPGQGRASAACLEAVRSAHATDEGQSNPQMVLTTFLETHGRGVPDGFAAACLRMAWRSVWRLLNSVR